MKRVYIIFLSLILTIQNANSQCNYLIVKWFPKSCGELTQHDECYNITGTYTNFLKKKYFNRNSSMVLTIDDSTHEFFNELTDIDKVILEVFNKKNIKLMDTANMFYMEFITGFNDTQNNHFKVYGVVNCILFLDRIIEKLLIVNPKSKLMEVFRIDQEILLYDRLCKCDYP